MKRMLLLGLSCALFMGCGSKPKSAPTPSPTPPTPSNMVIIPPDSPKLAQIRVEPMKMEAIPAGEVTSPGKVEANPNRISRVPLPAAGKVTRVLVKLGDSVAAGQPLLILESPDADAAMAAFLLLPLLGVVLQGTSSVLYATVGEFVEPDRLPRSFGLFYTIGSICGIAAPLGYGLLGDRFGVGAAIGTMGVVILLTIPLATLLKPRFAPASQA